MMVIQHGILLQTKYTPRPKTLSRNSLVSPWSWALISIFILWQCIDTSKAGSRYIAMKNETTYAIQPIVATVLHMCQKHPSMILFVGHTTMTYAPNQPFPVS